MQGYQNNFITNFIIKLDFYNDTKEFATEIPADIVNVIKENFPRVQPTRVLESSLEVSETKTSRQDVNFPQWIYTDNKNQNKIVINKKYISIESITYESFKKIEDLFHPLLEKIFNIPNIQVSRVGIRYINQLRKHRNFFNDINKISDWKKYINSDLISNISFIDEFNTSNLISSIEMNYDGFMVRFKYGINNINYPLPIKEPNFILDYDGFTTNLITSMEDFKEMEENIHTKIEELFEKSINEELRNVLDGK